MVNYFPTLKLFLIDYHV